MKKAIFLVFISILVVGIKLNSRAQVLEGPPRDGIYDKSAVIQMQPIPYSPVREADVIWSKRIWRVIDMREKINQPFYFPEKAQNGWRSFMQIIMDAMKEGTIQGYSDLSDQFLYPISYKEVMDKLESQKTVKLTRPDTQEEYDTIIAKKFNPTDVYKVRIKEDYFFDKQRSVMEVRILGICPVVDSKDDKGESRGICHCSGFISLNAEMSLQRMNSTTFIMVPPHVFLMMMFS